MRQKKKSKRKLKKQNTLKILAAADLHGDTETAQKLAKKAKKEKVDLVILAGDLHGMFEGQDIITPFKKAKQKVVFVPGNWDSKLEVDLLKEHQAKNIDSYYVTYNGVKIVGIGNQDMKMSLDNSALKRIIKNFEKIKSKTGKKILVSHLHAQGTKAEFSGIQGEKTLRQAIDYFHPDIFISAHIHEAEGLEEKIGKTKVIQVGRKGKIIEI